MLLLGLVSAMIVPGGLFTRMLGNAVVTRRGTEIGRAISLARVLVALVTRAALGIGAIVTIARPERGPHDRLLRTWVVPR